MDSAALERAYEAFMDFHGYFAPAFGRKQPRELSRHCLQALLVQSHERRNAENLPEAVAASPRALRRLLTESPWDDDGVLADCRNIWVSGWGIRWRRGCWTAATFPSNG